MSSPRINFHPKRRSDDESSLSDSDENVLPIKRARISKRESSRFPKYLLYVKDIFTNTVKDWVDWIYKLPIGYYDKCNLYKSNMDHNVPIEIDDDDEDQDVVELDAEDDDPVIEEHYTCMSDKSPRKDNLIRISIPIVTDPHSSTPIYREIKTSRGRSLNSLSRLPVNGCKTKAYPTRDKRNGSNYNKMRYNRCIAPISNPSSDVEILLDTRETPDEESDDLEIVSEIPNTNSSRRLTRQTTSRIASKFGQSSRECNGSSPSSAVNGKAASSERKRSLNKSFTAHEVIRLQEKAHYQLILDKMIGTTTYHPAVAKKNPKPREIQVDLTEDDEPVIDTRYKKANLEKPVNEFLQKYYKPCQFTPCAAPKDNSDDVEVFTVDDDVQVIETKPSNEDSLFNRPMARKRPDIFSTDWINELKKTITLETEQRLQIVAQQEEKLERYRKRRDAKIIKEKLLRGLPVSEKAETDEFPELTPEMEERIESALTLMPDMSETLSTFKDCICSRSDMLTLAGLNWLNDSVINFYLALVKERSKDHLTYPSVHAFSSFFYTSLKSRGVNVVLRWTKRLEGGKNIFQFDLLFVPLHFGMHWALCVIDNRSKKIKYYDSMQGTDDQCLKILQNYLVCEKANKLGITMDPDEYSLEIVKDIPQQMNGSDCGMFTLKYAEYLSRGVPITFSQEHMQYFRRRMVIEILDKKLF